MTDLASAFPDCPPPALLQAAQAEVLPAPLQSSVSAHIESCAACAALLDDLDQLDSAPLGVEAEQRIWRRVRVPWWRQPFVRPLGACLAVAVVLLLLLAPRLMKTSSPPPAPPLVAKQPPHPDAFRLEKPPVILPASALLVWRGGPAQGQELRDALAPFQTSDYAEAERRLQSFSKKNPDMPEAHFYLGICQLFLSRPGEAARELQAAQSSDTSALRNRAAWYLALAHHQSGHDSQARPLFEQLCGAGGPDSARACAAAGELRAPAK